MTNSPETPTSPSPSATSAVDPTLAAVPTPTSLIGGPLPDATPPASAVEPPAAVPAAEPAPAFEPLTLDKLALPEGLSLMDGDKPLPEATELLELLNGAKVPAEAATKLLALHDKFLQKAADDYLAVWEKTQAEWRKGVETMPEFGGAALPETLTQIAKVVDRYGDAEVREAFAVTGAGNHPAIVRFIAKIARDMNEAPPTRGSKTSSVADRAGRMYPSN